MIFCGQRNSQIKGALINHSYDSLIKHGKALKRIAFRWCKSAGNIWQLSNLFVVLHDLMLAVCHIFRLFLALTPFKQNMTPAKRVSNMPKPLAAHPEESCRQGQPWQWKTASGIRKSFSIVHPNQLHKQFCGSRYIAKSRQYIVIYTRERLSASKRTSNNVMKLICHREYPRMNRCYNK